jgi:hypothetical protein
MAELGEHREIVARPTADLEDVGSGWRSDAAADQRGEHLAPGTVPPVPLIELRHLLVNDALHQRKTQ